jgi:hypothetical protein
MGKVQGQRRRYVGKNFWSHPKSLSKSSSLWRIDKKSVKDGRDHCPDLGSGHV